MTASPAAYEALRQALDSRTREVLDMRRSMAFVRRRGWLMRRMLLASDVLGLVIAFSFAEVAYLARTNEGVVNVWGEIALFTLSLPLWVVVAKLYGLYDRDEERADHSTADDVVGVLHLVTIGTWLFYAGAYASTVVHPEFSKLLTFWVLAVVTIPLLRSLARSRCRRSIHYVQNTIVVGSGTISQAVARKIIKHPEYGINLVGFVDHRSTQRNEDLAHLALLGELQDLTTLVRLLDVERVIVGFPDDPSANVVALLRELNEMRVQVDVLPRFFEVMSPAADFHSVEGIPLIGLRPPRLSRSSGLLKRCLDVAGATAGLLILGPLLALIAAAIKLDSRGPVFFHQVRMGSGGHVFRIVKFRTMGVDADERKADVEHLNKHARRGGDPRMFKIDGDPRTTRVGRLLRRSSLDELPQLWNVLCGEMSLVGPRPLILDEHAHVKDWATRRLDLRPGMTGLWQVLGRDEIPFDEMVRLDYLYVTGWSLGVDIKLICRTFPILWRSRDAV